MASTAPSSLSLNLLQPHVHRHLRRAALVVVTGVGRSAPRPPGLVPRRGRPRPGPRPILSRASNDGGGGAAEASPSRPAVPPDIERLNHSDNTGDGYVGLFVRMLGLDNDPLDREQAITTLWRYSEGGKNCIDRIMQFSGCISLVINLLKSDSHSTCEAAAGLLRNISSVNLYRHTMAESGAIEEITGLLWQSSLTIGVKEQCLCTLWNLSIDEKLRVKIADSDLLPLLVRFLDDEEIKVKEASGGVLANLALSPCNHSIMVEAGVISKLADLLKSDAEGFNVIRKEAKTALLELSKDDYYRILIIEDGLVRVPIIGAAAYKSFKPLPHSWPSLPDGTEIEQTPSPSRYGASELLLGLNVRQKNINLEEAKMAAMVGRSQQQFLARIGAIEMEDGKKPQSDSSLEQQHTLLPWIDGVARLVLILGLEDVSAVSRAAHSIADASISEHMRLSFKEAGAIKPLIQLLRHDNETVKEAVAHALERLSISHIVCQMMEAEGVLDPLVNILKHTNNSNLLEKTVNILAQIFDPGKDMKKKFDEKIANGTKELLGATSFLENSKSAEISGTLISEVNVRDQVIDSGAISRLIEVLRSSSPTFQAKVASIMEYIATSASYVATITTAGIKSGLDAVFQQGSLDGLEGNVDNPPELTAAEAEEIGLAVAGASRLLTKLLDFEQFSCSIDSTHFVLVLRKILRSNVLPLHTKDWVAACLIKLESHLGPDTKLRYPIDMEVTLYDTIPRLVEQMRMSISYESQEAAVVELNQVISRGIMECTTAIAAAGGIFPLVKMIAEGSGDGLEASLSILYNLSMDSENHSAIVAAGAVPVLKRIVLSEGPHWARALRLLRTLPT